MLGAPAAGDHYDRAFELGSGIGGQGVWDQNRAPPHVACMASFRPSDQAILCQAITVSSSLLQPAFLMSEKTTQLHTAAAVWLDMRRLSLRARTAPRIAPLRLATSIRAQLDRC